MNAWILSCGHVRKTLSDMRVEEGDMISCYECPAKPITHFPPQREVIERTEDDGK